MDRATRAATSWCDTATTTTLRSRPSAGPTSAAGSTGRSIGSTPSRGATRERRCASSVRTDGTDRSYSFAELAARSDRLAISLAADGVVPGDRVMVMLGNQVELWESMLA
jgi:acyl-CoA synthetase (AMP-forming)/AMP-acid ligase II